MSSIGHKKITAKLFRKQRAVFLLLRLSVTDKACNSQLGPLGTQPTRHSATICAQSAVSTNPITD